jgi:DNA repair protein RadC
VTALDPLPQPLRIGDANAAGDLFAPLADEPFEVVALVYLDAGQRVLGMRHTRSESNSALDLPIRAIAAEALALDAAGVVMAHNHPSGDPTPSIADREATRLLARALGALDVRLLDHLVVARSGITSFRALGLL